MYNASSESLESMAEQRCCACNQKLFLLFLNHSLCIQCGRTVCKQCLGKNSNNMHGVCNKCVYNGYIQDRACGWIAKFARKKFNLSEKPTVVVDTSANSGHLAMVRTHTENVIRGILGSDLQSVLTTTWNDSLYKDLLDR